jgi:hypothetical protein
MASNASSVHFIGDKGEHRISHDHLFTFYKFLRDQLGKKGTYVVIRDEYKLPEKLKWEGRLSLQFDNAGGKSEVSEAFSIDYFNRVHKSIYTIFEKQVQYWIDYKMVDFITSIIDDSTDLFEEIRIGVSVTRAMLPPGKEDSDVTEEFGQELLDKKISGLIIARNGVLKQNTFFRSVLHIWCQSRKIIDVVEKAAKSLNPKKYGLHMKSSFCVLLTLCADPKLYTNYYDIPSDI